MSATGATTPGDDDFEAGPMQAWFRQLVKATQGIKQGSTPTGLALHHWSHMHKYIRFLQGLQMPTNTKNRKITLQCTRDSAHSLEEMKVEV